MSPISASATFVTLSPGTNNRVSVGLVTPLIAVVTPSKGQDSSRHQDQLLPRSSCPVRFLPCIPCGCSCSAPSFPDVKFRLIHFQSGLA